MRTRPGAAHALYDNRARRIAHDGPAPRARLSRLDWSGHLPYLIASTLAADVLNARSPMDPADALPRCLTRFV